jgi:hypothetical protein
MATERYPGERRGLSLFLEDLLPAVEGVCGRHALLFHAIRRGLATGDLDYLRHARAIFNHLPREHRQLLAGAVVAGSRGVPEPPAHELLEAYSQRDPAPFVSFEAGRRGDVPASVTLTHELLPPSPVRVMVSPGTLPRTAADSLRRIAVMIEQDRRLLSDRYWRGEADGGPASTEHSDRL